MKNVDPEDRLGRTPLHEALDTENDPKEFDLSVVKILLKAGANPNSKTIVGRTPLHYAMLRGNETAVNLLRTSGASDLIKNADGMTPIEALRAHVRSLEQMEWRTSQDMEKVKFYIGFLDRMERQAQSQGK